MDSKLTANIWLLGMGICTSKRQDFFLKVIQILLSYRLQFTDDGCSTRRWPVDGGAWALIFSLATTADRNILKINALLQLCAVHAIVT